MLSSAKSVNNTSRRTGSSRCDVIAPSKPFARTCTGSRHTWLYSRLVFSRTALLDLDSVFCHYLAVLYYVVILWTCYGLLCGIGLLAAFDCTRILDGEFSRVLRLLVI